MLYELTNLEFSITYRELLVTFVELSMTLQGIIRFHIVAARDLKAADIGLGKKGKSDPYVKLYGTA